ncbi:hypothetical protein ASPACDRAFT_82547 [Aspergillus aculeatus ATCC 16872]|uniref:Actin binding protein n=1 Tax=Aspergillus aculeatus (strain ATCC 16872 / CBS 172.66 / WB 5094) TaxID=690307 RepID=A0A1L9WEJ5_ASPA1|nr:uncharacterized protein ASPACDRAFT_82547 [Aspergillus aculeatus ATCC 16872]OJJ94596.1 hypothetical protein ASPACDRAFT_82547 [Aspergillus aculeatus ATCC 16872]
MATLNLSTNGPSIAKSYQAVVDSALPGSNSLTHGQWVVFSVSTPLINAFQQDSGNKESVLKVQNTGAGELVDLIEEFSEGKIQFAFVKILDPNSGLPKNVLIAWCGEGVPERTKGYFTSHLAAVSKFLHGYHVQITARSDQDLSAEGIIQKVGDASGAKYTPGPDRPTSTPKPPVSTKPAFNPARTGGTVANNPAIVASRVAATIGGDDGWGPDAPPVTRTGLQKVQSAYRPTKVNIQELKADGQSDSGFAVSRDTEDRDKIVKGGYKPIGKVDIAAIRRQAREAGNLADDRPEPVKGAYQPVGKVDIAAIRAKAQGGITDPVNRPTSVEPRPLPDMTGSFKPSNASPVASQYERLTSLPKPKVAKNITSNSTFVGTKPPLPTQTSQATAPLVGSASRTFADEGGKTPAQLWSERKARERGSAFRSTSSNSPDAKIDTPIHTDVQSLQGNSSKHPVHVAQSRDIPESSELPLRTEKSDPGLLMQSTQESTNVDPGHISHDKYQSLKHEKELVPTTSRAVPVPESPTTVPATDLEGSYQSRGVDSLPTPPQQPRSPTPPTPSMTERELSPIRVAAPVGKGLTDIQSEQQSPPPVLPTESLQQALPKEDDLEDDAHDIGRATAEATVNEDVQRTSIQAVVLYDYEKAEDNEVELKEGDFVNDVEMVDKDWWLGTNVQGDRGLFPSNYVEIVTNPSQSHDVADRQTPLVDERAPSLSNVEAAPSTMTPEPAGEPIAVALYDYEAAEDNELSFPEGAEITHIEFPDDDWWFGHYDGKTGLFPANYVQLGN